MAFLHKHNTDDVFSRAIIVGMVNLLNDKIKFINQLSDTKRETIEVPWFFNQSGDERFMQDYFTFWNDCIHPKFADGNYDILPRGVVTLSGETINTSALTHRFVRGKYLKEIEGQLQTFNAFLHSIPLTISFECEIQADSYINALKIQQSIRETFYSTQVFHTSFKGFRIPCQVGFPEDLGLQKTFEYSYGDDNKITFNFSLDVETYHPVIDPLTEMSDANRIHGFGPSVDVDDNSTYKGKTLKITSPELTPELNYFSDSILPIKWDSTGNIMRVNLYYRLDNETSDWTTLELSYENNGLYNFKLPYFRDNKTYIVYSQNPINTPKIRLLINLNGSVYDYVIIDGGMGFDSKLQLSIEEEGFRGTPAEIIPIVENGMIKELNILSGGSGYNPTIGTAINIKVEDANDSSIYDIIECVLVL